MTREGCPTPGDLLRYSAGETDVAESQRIERHLVECPSCAGTLERVATVESALRAVAAQAVPAGHCLREDDVLALADGSLPTASVDDVLAHVASCGSCSALLADLWIAMRPARWDAPDRAVRGALARLEAASEAAVVRIVRDGIELVRRFAGDQGTPSPALAFARAPGDVALLWRGQGLAVDLAVRARGGDAELLGIALTEGRPDPTLTVGLVGRDVARGPESPDVSGRFGPWPLGTGMNTLTFHRPSAPGTVTLELAVEPEEPTD